MLFWQLFCGPTTYLYTVLMQFSFFLFLKVKSIVTNDVFLYGVKYVVNF